MLMIKGCYGDTIFRRTPMRVVTLIYQQLHRQHPKISKMAKQNNNKKIEYARRLKELKQKLKPYRDSQTVNLLRLITGSSRVNLDNYWESLESVLNGDCSHRAVKMRLQSVVNMILENGEYAKPKKAHSNSRVDMVNKNFTHLHIDPKANVVENVRHMNIDSKANMVDNVRHINIDSKANVFDNVRRINIDSKANVFDNVRRINIDSKARMFDNVRHNDIDSKADVLGNARHGDINSNLNVFDNVEHRNINLKADVINRLRHLHIDSCKPACYNRF